MSRQRFIDPGIWSSRDFSTLPLPARQLFMGLFSTCDDWGRIKADPYPLVNSFFREDDLTEVDVAEFLEILAGRHMVEHYTARDGTPLLWLPTFHTYQPMRYHAKSRLDRHPTDHSQFNDKSGNPIDLAPCGNAPQCPEVPGSSQKAPESAGKPGTFPNIPAVVAVATVVAVDGRETDDSASPRPASALPKPARALKPGELGTAPETSHMTDLIPVKKKGRRSKRPKKKMRQKKKRSRKQKIGDVEIADGQDIARRWETDIKPACGLPGASTRKASSMRKAAQSVKMLKDIAPELIEDRDKLIKRIIVDIERCAKSVRKVICFDWVFVKGNLAALLNGNYRKGKEGDGRAPLESWKGGA